MGQAGAPGRLSCLIASLLVCLPMTRSTRRLKSSTGRANPRHAGVFAECVLFGVQFHCPGREVSEGSIPSPGTGEEGKGDTMGSVRAPRAGGRPLRRSRRPYPPSLARRVLFMEPAPGRRPVPAAAATRSVCTGQQWGGTGPRTGQVRRRRRRPVTARAVSADSCRRYRLTWLSADHQPATGLAKQRAGSHTAGTLTSGDGDCTADLG